MTGNKTMSNIKTVLEFMTQLWADITKHQLVKQLYNMYQTLFQNATVSLFYTIITTEAFVMALNTQHCNLIFGLIAISNPILAIAVAATLCFAQVYDFTNLVKFINMYYGK